MDLLTVLASSRLGFYSFGSGSESPDVEASRVSFVTTTWSSSLCARAIHVLCTSRPAERGHNMTAAFVDLQVDFRWRIFGHQCSLIRVLCQSRTGWRVYRRISRLVGDVDDL